MPVLQVLSTRDVNSAVVRLHLDKNVSIDLPRVSGLPLDSLEALKLEVNPPNGAECVLCGTVYHVLDGFSFISCGGLLVKLNIVAETGTTVRIGLSKSRRRERARNVSDAPAGKMTRMS